MAEEDNYWDEDDDEDDDWDDDDDDDIDADLEIVSKIGSEEGKKPWAIQPGHGKKDISCHHGSRWIWWPGEDNKGAWMNVVLSSQCDCMTPPRPDNVPEQLVGEQVIPFDSSKYHKMEDYFKRTL